METITEKDNKQEAWYAEAKGMTLEKLPAFLDRLMTEYEHDYGTICHAVAAGGIATMWAMNKDEKQGGITGFQASAIMWEFIQHWMSYDSPMKLLQYRELLYPQDDYKFTTISKDTWKWVQKEASKILLEELPSQSVAVRDRLKSIVVGIIPCGFMLEDRE